MSVTVYAPASIGNFSVGFDVLGAALKPIDGRLFGDRVTACFKEISELSVSGPYADKLPDSFSENIVWNCLESFHKKLTSISIETKSVSLHLEKNLPIGSGLGSSASSIVAALVALNHLYGNPFESDELLCLMGTMEAEIAGSLHYDNIAPSYLGGLQLMLANGPTICRSLPVFQEWYFVVAYSGISISTKAARELLPDSFSRKDLVAHSQQLASFIDALYRKDPQQALLHLSDSIAEPVRKMLLPKFTRVKKSALNIGSQFVGISGSGPTIFSISPSLENAQNVADYFSDEYLQNEQGFVHICQLDDLGTTQIPD